MSARRSQSRFRFARPDCPGVRTAGRDGPDLGEPDYAAETEGDAEQTEQVESAQVDPVEAYAPPLDEAAHSEVEAKEVSLEGAQAAVSRLPRPSSIRLPTTPSTSSSQNQAASSRQPISHLPAPISQLTMGIEGARTPMAELSIAEVRVSCGEPRLGLDFTQSVDDRQLAGRAHHSLRVAGLDRLVISLPLGFLVFKTKQVANVILAFLGVIYSIRLSRSFVMMPLILGTKILNPANIVVALSIYSIALLVRERRGRAAFRAGCCEAIRLGRGLRLAASAAPCRVAAGHAGDLRRSSCRHRVEHRPW
jgi:hypothetical protein